MKLLAICFATVLLSQISYATGGAGEDPNMALPSSTGSSEAGSTFTSAVSKSDQPAFCEKCEERSSARLSNNVGVLTTSTGSAVKESSGQPDVKTGQ